MQWYRDQYGEEPPAALVEQAAKDFPEQFGAPAPQAPPPQQRDYMAEAVQAEAERRLQQQWQGEDSTELSALPRGY